METALTIDIAEATCLTFLCVMKASSPVYSDITFTTIETGCTFHTTTCTDATKLKESVKDWTIVSHIKLALLFRIALHVVWSDFLQKLNVFISVKLGHLMLIGGLRSLRSLLATQSDELYSVA